MASATLTTFVYCSLFYLLNRFDWGEPFVKLACFQAFFVAIVLSAVGTTRRRGASVASWVLWIELACALTTLGWEAWRGLGLFHHGLRTSMNDIGGTTEEAIRGLFLKKGWNPYLHNISKDRSDPSRWAYKYGPGMLFAYALAAVWPDGVGIKISSAGYLFAAVCLVAFLSVPRSSRGTPVLPRVTTAAIACALFLLPARLYHELFDQGVNDIFPVMLLLACIALADHGRWLLSGVAVGVSFVTKFSPALFLVVVLVHYPVRWRFWLGFLLGLAPCIPFVVWDGPALLRNVVLFHLDKDFDPTSIYSIAPPELHWMFPIVQASAVLVAALLNILRPFSKRTTVLSFILLLITIQVSYREIHGNHQVWFMPVLALAFAWQRHGFAAFWPTNESPIRRCFALLLRS